MMLFGYVHVFFSSNLRSPTVQPLISLHCILPPYCFFQTALPFHIIYYAKYIHFTFSLHAYVATIHIRSARFI